MREKIKTQGKTQNSRKKPKTQGKNSTFGEQFLRLWHQVMLNKKACTTHTYLVRMLLKCSELFRCEAIPSNKVSLIICHCNSQSSLLKVIIKRTEHSWVDGHTWSDWSMVPRVSTPRGFFYWTEIFVVKPLRG